MSATWPPICFFYADFIPESTGDIRFLHACLYAAFLCKAAALPRAAWPVKGYFGRR